MDNHDKDFMNDKKRKKQDFKLALTFGLTVIIVIAVIVVYWVYLSK